MNCVEMYNLDFTIPLWKIFLTCMVLVRQQGVYDITDSPHQPAANLQAITQAGMLGHLLRIC